MDTIPAEFAMSATGTLRILVVDDHPDTLDVLRRVLTWDGHQVIPAPSYRSALEIAKSTPFDVLVSDVSLPDGSGWNLLRDLKASRPELPAIAISGHGMPHHIQQSEAAGFCAHLTKPVDFGRLKEAIAGCARVET